MDFLVVIQAGRGGRQDRPSLAIYVAFGGPLDQYFIKNARNLFERPIECCHIDSQNKQVEDTYVLICLILIIWNYIGPEKLPSHAVNIRAIETVRYSVIDQRKNEVLEEIEGKARLSFRWTRSYRVIRCCPFANTCGEVFESC
ncbi:hypothetical protein P8452_55944 [Trifolium repens]|nr:hypothetical protein P8452_55944 [Trifolium repens]